MTCKQAEEFITMCVDGELDPDTEEALMRHMEACLPCRNGFEQEQQIKALLAERIQRVRVPAHLSAQIRASFKRPPVPMSWWQRPGDFIDRYPRQVAMALAAMLLVTVISAVLFTRAAQSPPLLIVELVNHHTSCPVEIISAHPNDLEAWFEQRVNFAVDAPQLARFDCDLLGAHLCEILQSNAAYVEYTRNGQEISMCVIKGLAIDFNTLDRIEVRNMPFYTTEYEDRNLVLWQDDDRVWSFIGQVDRDDLLAMAIETRRL